VEDTSEPPAATLVAPVVVSDTQPERAPPAEDPPVVPAPAPVATDTAEPPAATLVAPVVVSDTQPERAAPAEDPPAVPAPAPVATETANLDLRESELGAAVKDVKAQLGDGRCVCVLGGQSFNDPASEDLVKALGAHLPAAVGDAVVFLTGGMRGVQETFATSAKETSGVRLFHLLPENEEPTGWAGTDIHIGANLHQRKQVFSEVGDIYICAEGGPGVSAEAQRAVDRGAVVIPLVRTGGASGGMFDFPAAALERPSFATEDQWSLLSNKGADVGDSAAAVAAIVAGLMREQARPSADKKVESEADTSVTQ